jgi:hypothetical protein
MANLSGVDDRRGAHQIQWAVFARHSTDDLNDVNAAYAAKR